MTKPARALDPGGNGKSCSGGFQTAVSRSFSKLNQLFFGHVAKFRAEGLLLLALPESWRDAILEAAFPFLP